ncbi:MAG: hypothetical protein WBB89_18770 [Candidatus Acidiferrum sp.]
MNSKLRRTSSVVVVLVLVGALLHAFGGNAAARSNREGRLQGTWRVQLNPRNCQTGAPIPSFAVLLSFHRGGTLTEVINAQALLPGQRTPGLGVWSHTQGNAYKGVWDAFILFDSPVFKRGVQRLMWDFEVDGDQLTIAATSQFLDPNGNPFIPPINTCASGTGTRFEEPQDED